MRDLVKNINVIAKSVATKTALNCVSNVSQRGNSQLNCSMNLSSSKNVLLGALINQKKRLMVTLPKSVVLYLAYLANLHTYFFLRAHRVTPTIYITNTFLI